jgi:hypothetical protein
VRYIYRNITTAHTPVRLIPLRKRRDSVTVIHKCDIANVSGSDATVSIYLETHDIDKTEHLYGNQDNGNFSETTNDYVNKADQEIYYKIKNVSIPVGTTLSLFTDHPCSHNSKFNFVIESSQNVDVILDYEINKFKSRSGSNNITISNQY